MRRSQWKLTACRISAAPPLHHFVNNGPDLLGRWGAGTEIGTALFWDRAQPVYHDPRQAHFTVALLLDKGRHNWPPDCLFPTGVKGRTQSGSGPTAVRAVSPGLESCR